MNVVINNFHETLSRICCALQNLFLILGGDNILLKIIKDVDFREWEGVH